MKTTLTFTLLAALTPGHAAADTVGIELGAKSTPPTPIARLHPDAHTDLGLGLGVQTAGFGVALGHRFASGLRLEGAAGTALLFSGGSLAAGYSLRVMDHSRDVLEIPLLAIGCAGFLARMGPGSPEDDDKDSSGMSLAALGAMTGIDWILGGAFRNDNRIILSARAGAVVLDDDAVVLPAVQFTVGASF